MKYATTQILYFGSFCALMGFASVYLLDHGFSNSVIGTVLALTSFIAVLTQPAVASFADKSQRIELRYIICAIMIVACVLSGCIYFMEGSSLVLLVVFVGIVTCMMTIQPLLNSLAFVFEKYGIEINYGLGRGLGSASYAIVSFIVGYLVEDFGTKILPLIYLLLNVLLVFVVYVYVIPKNEQKEMVKVKESEVSQQLSFAEFCKKYKRFMIFVLGIVAVFFDHTIINNFFIQILKPIGGTESQMGTAVFIAAIVELPAMALFNKIREKVNCARLIQIAVILFAVKHGLIYFATNVTMVYIAQFLQIATYAIITPASVYYVNQKISQSDAIKGQSMVTAAITASGIVANIAGGLLLDSVGVKNVLLIGVIVSIIGAGIVILSVENEK
jgi:Cyanate permease